MEKEERKSTIEEAKNILTRLEEANAKMEANLARAEEIKAEEILGGRAEAGIVPEKPAEETAREYAQRVMSGKV